MLDIVDELRKLLSLFQRHNVEYALCGGLAMAVHVRPRATIDIDLLVLSDSVDEIFAFAKELGYQIRDKDLSFANGAIEIRRVSKIDPDDGDLLSLDLLLVTPQIGDVWDSRIEAEWERGNLTVVSARGLITLKEIRGSGQDLDDIKLLRGEASDEQS
jgi:hypothetical protein